MLNGEELASFLLAHGKNLLDIYTDREGRRYVYTDDMRRIYLPE